MIETLQAPRPPAPLSKSEVEARVRVIKWQRAQALLNAAQAALAEAANSHFTASPAQPLIENLQRAQAEADQAKLESGPVDKEKDANLIRHVLEKHAQSTWRQAQQGYDETRARQAQQDHERARIELETAQATAATSVRRESIGTAPAFTPHPFSEIPRDLLADWDLDEDEERSPADRGQLSDAERPDTHIQETPPTPAETLQVGQSGTRPLNDPVMQREAELRDGEVQGRADRLKDVEQMQAPEAQGEEQAAGPAHGRVENKDGGYDPQKKGAEPKKPDEKD